MNRESYDKSIEFTIDTLMKDKFHPDFVKELTWLLEGEFKETFDMIKRLIEEIYLPEEIITLIEVYTKYPWMIQKREVLTQRLSAESMKNGQKTAQMIFNNLNSTGDLQRIVEEGFFINEQPEYDTPEDF